jgi:hypothetical protein
MPKSPKTEIPAEWDGTERMRPCIDLRSLSA